jgi:hypothetical protein
MQQKDSISKVTVRCVGDIAPVQWALDVLGSTASGEDGSQLWNSLPQADLTLANLEAPVAPNLGFTANKRYNLQTDASALNLFGPGSVVSLANNHIMDCGEEGLAATIAALDARGITYAGAGRNLEEARQPAMINIGGVTVAVLCCADPRFNAATANSAGTCPATHELIEASVRDLRSLADVVILSVHMGIEFFPVPSDRQLELAELGSRAGASLVHFHHAHTISGVQKIGECTVLFGTGNFLFPYVLGMGHRRAWHKTAAWSVDVTVERPELVSTSVSWTPMLIDSNGLPAPAPARVAQQIDRQIRRWSKRIDSRTALPAWRFLYMFRPGYVWLAIVNYGDMIRRLGLINTAREFGRGFRGSFMGRS